MGQTVDEPQQRAGGAVGPAAGERTRRSPLAVDPGRPDRRGLAGDESLRHRAGADRGAAAGAGAESAPAAGLAVQTAGAAHAGDRPSGALVDVGRSAARTADGDRRAARGGARPRRKNGYAGAAAEKRYRFGARGGSGAAWLAGLGAGTGCAAGWLSISVIFCQIFRDRLDARFSTSLTPSMTTSSLTDCAKSAAILPVIDSISEQ